MRLLVLGGTAFLGHAVAREALERGHEVACLARGSSGAVPDGARLVRVDRAEPGAGLGGVEEEDWDGVVDVGRLPGPVGRAARWLAPRTRHAVLVSTGNVYADHSVPGADESTPLLPARRDGGDDPDAYGAAKAACEEEVVAAFGPERVLVARVGLIGGPGDVSGRTAYWPWRMAHPAGPEVLVPDVPDAPCQVVDVRDLAAWFVRAVEDRVAGVADAVGPTHRFAEHLGAAAEAAGTHPTLAPVDSGWLAEQGVAEWMGPRSLPLWLTDPAWAGFTSRRGDAARALGLATRPLEETLRDVLAWEEHRPADLPRRAGLSDEEERELLTAWHARPSTN
ncbi:MAG TPA: NAD-dependent epimerase/dehydratase family protein [Phycicoccus sp.]|nr:NAD-dependent epimerase/dehydratase family protein [Phycicoccus sp.]